MELYDAIDFAADAHRDHYRKVGNIPYISHPFGVLHALRDAGVKQHSILIAAVLHDTVEDTAVTLDDIRVKFGAEVAGYVDEVTDDKTLPKVQRKRMQIEHVDTMSPEACLIKLADKYHNLSSFSRSGIPEGWSSKRVKGYFAWAWKICRIIDQRGGFAHYKSARDELLERLNKVFNGSFELNGEWHSCLPEGNREAMLEEYLKEMETLD